MRFIFLPLYCLAFNAHAAAPAFTLRLLTEHTPPASMVVGSMVTGRETAKIREIMARTDTHYSLEILPWRRAYLTAISKADTCVYSTSRTPEREALFKWVGPMDEAEWQFWGRADRAYLLKTLEDARRLRIGTYSGDAREQYLRDNGFTVESVSNDLLNPEKLLLGRIDLWAVGVRRGAAGPSDPQWAGKVIPLMVFHRVKVYLACNTSVPDAAIARLNAAVADMWRDGTMARLNHQYENWTSTWAR